MFNFLGGLLSCKMLEAAYRVAHSPKRHNLVRQQLVPEVLSHYIREDIAVLQSLKHVISLLETHANGDLRHNTTDADQDFVASTMRRCEECESSRRALDLSITGVVIGID